PGDAQPLGGGGAEHGDRFAGGGRVEVVAVGDAGAHGGGQAEARRLHGEGAGVDGGGQRAAVDLGVHGAGGLDGGDRPDAGDHGGGGFGEFGGAAEQGLPVGDRQQVGAELADFGEQPGGGGRGQAEHGHDRGDADGDAQGGQPGAQLAGAQPDAGDPGQVRGPQPPGRGPARAGRGGGGGHRVPPWTGPGTGASRSAGALSGAGAVRVVSVTIRPSSISIWRGARAAMPRSWVMSTMVTP